MTKRKRKNNDLQNITYKTKDRVTRTPLKTGGDFSWFLNCYITETTTIWYIILILRQQRICSSFFILWAYRKNNRTQ